jgi:hypothetical protein
MDPDLQQLENEKKAADLREAIAKAKKAEAEARRDAEAAERSLAIADEKARRDAKEAEATTRKAIAEADAAAIKAYLPDKDPTLKPLEGSVSGLDDKAGIVAETAAYALFMRAAKLFVKQVKDKLDKDNARVLVVTNPELTVSDWPYHAIRQQTDRLSKELDEVLKILVNANSVASEPESVTEEEEPVTEDEEPVTEEDMVAGLPVLAAASALPVMVGAAADIAGYFASNYTVAGRNFQVKTEPLVAAMAGALAEAGVRVVVDGFHILPETTTIMISYDAVLGARWKVVSARLELEQGKLARATADMERCKAEFTRRQTELSAIEAATPVDEPKRKEARNQLEQAAEELHKAETATGNLQSLVEVAKAAEQRVDALVTTVTAVPANGGLPPIGVATRYETLHEVTHVMSVAVSSSGGETQVRQRRFFAPTLRYVGSCTLSVLLAETDGTIIYSRSQTLVGQLTYQIKDGTLGQLREVRLS